MEKRRRIRYILLVATLFWFVTSSPSHGASLTTASLTPSDSRATPGGGTFVTYTVNVSNVTLVPTSCLQLEFDTQINGNGGGPPGLSVNSSGFSTGSSNFLPSWTGFSSTIDNSNAAITMASATPQTPASASSRTAVFTGVYNGSTSGTTYYAFFRSYSDQACTSLIDSVTMPVIFTDATTVSVSVDPSFSFSVAARATACNSQVPTSFSSSSSATTVQMGNANGGVSVGGAQDLTFNTNAFSGGTVYLRSTVAPNALRTAGGVTIADVSGTHASPGAAPVAGTPGFGYTTSDASVAFGSNQFAKLTTTNDSVLISNAAGSKTSCVGYQAAVSGTTAAGAYTATVIYTAVPAF